MSINIAFGKFLVILGIELAAAAASICQPDGVSILTSFTAFAVISDLAGMYFNSIQNDDVKTSMLDDAQGKIVATRNMKNYPKNNNHENRAGPIEIREDDDIPEIETGTIAEKFNNLWYNKLWTGLYFIIEMFMELFYFYFFPFIIFCLYVVYC
jgi:hypothetical protein